VYAPVNPSNVFSSAVVDVTPSSTSISVEVSAARAAAPPV